MAIIACPECGSSVSDKAPTCPQCGCPIAQTREQTAIGTPVTTTQNTSKALKSQSIAALVLTVGGCSVAMTGTPGSGESAATLGAAAMVIGLVWYVVTRIRIWWHHG